VSNLIDFKEAKMQQNTDLQHSPFSFKSQQNNKETWKRKSLIIGREVGEMAIHQEMY
jgi:hypothetical protein